MAVGRYLDDAAVPTITVAGLDAANDRFLVHDDSNTATPTSQVLASQILDRLLSTTSISHLTALANFAATASGDSLLLFDASDPKLKPLPWSEVQNRLLSTTSLAALATTWTDLSALDPTADFFLIFDASGTAFVKVRADVIASALRNITPSHKTSTPVTLNATSDQALALTNYGATQVIEFDIPAAVVGMRYSFQRIADYAIRLDPNGTDVIADGAAGKYLQMQAMGRIDLLCLVANRWEIVNDTCATWDFEV